MCYNDLLITIPIRRRILMAEKPLPDLQEFIKNVNKKDKLNGKKIKFCFVKRKRKK